MPLGRLHPVTFVNESWVDYHVISIWIEAFKNTGLPLDPNKFGIPKLLTNGATFTG
jgi:hypothetical protein